jgi:hypothetical protein
MGLSALRVLTNFNNTEINEIKKVTLDRALTLRALF